MQQLESGSKTMRGLVVWQHFLVKEALVERKWLVLPVSAMMGREGPRRVFGKTSKESIVLKLLEEVGVAELAGRDLLGILPSKSIMWKVRRAHLDGNVSSGTMDLIAFTKHIVSDCSIFVAARTFGMASQGGMAAVAGANAMIPALLKATSDWWRRRRLITPASGCTSSRT